MIVNSGEPSKSFSFPFIPGVLRLSMKELLGVACICSSSKSNSVGDGGLEKKVKRFVINNTYKILRQ